MLFTNLIKNGSHKSQNSMARSKYIKKRSFYIKRKRYQHFVQVFDDNNLTQASKEMHKAYIVVKAGTDAITNSESFANTYPTATPIMKVSRLNVKGAINARTQDDLVKGVAALVYLPQGISLDTFKSVADTYFLGYTKFINAHPEWVIKYKYLYGYYTLTDSGTSYYNFNMNMSSTLKRNLKSGDAIYMIYALEGLSNTVTVNENFVVSGFTCTN